MKSVIPAIREILINNPAVVALIKTGTGLPRLYIMRAEQFTAGGDIIMNEISGTMNSSLEEGSTGPWESRVSLECRASQYQTCLQISDAVKAALLPSMGLSKGLDIHKIVHAGEYSDYNDEGSVFRHIIDFRAHYGV